ncbi:MAG: S8 family serine peptidase [Candidatus Zixiibacteriota bacterium]
MTRWLALRALAPAVLGLALMGSDASARVYPGQAPFKTEMVKGKVTVQMEDGVDVARMALSFGKVRFGVASLDKILDDNQVDNARPVFTNARKPEINSGLKDLTRFYELSFPESRDVRAVITDLMQNPHVRVAEPVWTMTVDASPNDPQWPSQWHMEPPGPDPNVYTAWDIETGADTIKIAIIDTGVNFKHTDLTGNIWVNPGEDLDHDGVVADSLDDRNNIDDDGNGFIDDLIGWDFVTSISGGTYPGEDGGTPDWDPNDHNGHGTHVAGIAAAMTNNTLNVTGMAGGWFGGHRSFRGVRIMCVRAGGTRADGRGTLNSNDVANAINYAVANGAKAINASFGGGSFNSTEAAAIDNAITSGCSFIHSAGNDTSSVAGWEDVRTGVMSVAATNSGDFLADFSNYGSWIDVCAPGVSILSTYSNFYTPTTAILDGTSMSAPVVTGLNALIRSANPSLTRNQVDSLIMMTADPIDAINPTYAGQLGWGRVNANTALSSVGNAKFSGDVLSGNVPLTVNFSDLSPNTPSSWDWTFGDGGTSMAQNPLHTYTTAGPNGVYDVGLRITDAVGDGEEQLLSYIWARADTAGTDSMIVERPSKVTIPIYLHNTSPIKELQYAFSMQNTANITLDSFSVVGTRASYFAQAQYSSFVPSLKQYAIFLKSYSGTNSNYLPADTGVVLKLFINVPSNAPKGTVVTFDTITIGTRTPYMASIWGSYWPVWKIPKIKVRQTLRGDLTNDGAVDISDLQAMIDFLFFGGPAPDPYAGNVDGLGGIDISDLSYLVDYLFFGGPPPPA